MPPLSCVRRPDGVGSSSIELSGELDLATCPEFREMLREAQGEEGSVSIDLQDLTFIDGTGLEALVSAAGRAASSRSQLIVVGASGQVKRLLDLTMSPFQGDPTG